MANLNIFGRDWKANLKKQSIPTPIVIDHGSGRVLSEVQIKREIREAFLKAMMTQARQYSGN